MPMAADEPERIVEDGLNVTLDDQIHNDAEGMSIADFKNLFSKRKSSESAGTNETKEQSKFMKAFDPSLKFGGYIIGKYSATDKKSESHSSFDLRLVRLYMNGYAFKDFYYRLQVEVNGAPGEDKGPRIVDAFIEWQHFTEFRVKLGQFKRSFGFENPFSPLDVGWGTYSQLTNRLVSLVNDRVGEHKSGGRDLGLQIQGDFFPAKDGHRWLHYQIGLFNGQGVNHSDKDNHKDLIGGLWISPVKNLRIGGFGWNGKYTNEKFDATNPSSVKSVKRIRYGFGVDYESDWVVRAEYVHSVGGVINNPDAAQRSDAWYATVGVPVVKGLKIYAKYDVYRDAKTWDSMNAIYGLAANYRLGKHLIFQLGYYLANNRASRSDKYNNTLDLQVYASF